LILSLSSLTPALAGDAADSAVPSGGAGSFEEFRKHYPLPPVHDYTFLGTELSGAKPIVSFGGRIEFWFDPADHVPWVKQSVAAGKFDVQLVHGFLPALHYVYHKPDS